MHCHSAIEFQVSFAITGPIEVVGAQVPLGVARAMCLCDERVSNQPLKRLPSSPFYRHKGEGKKGIKNVL
jgi:hypothetical protein